MARTPFEPQVFLDENAHPVLVFGRGRSKYHAVTAKGKTRKVITLVELTTLQGLRPLERNGEPYPPRRCASRWLNHDFRKATKRAERVLRGLVARNERKEESETSRSTGIA